MMPWRALGPAVPKTTAVESLRAMLGMALGLLVTEMVLWLAHPGATALLLIAPFGASSLLINLVPTSPLAQPWAVVVGNLVSALAALIALSLPLPGLAQASLAVMLVVPMMALTRSLHPPGGAMALAMVLMALSGHQPGWDYLASPVALGCLSLVGFGAIWGWLTGQPYPALTGAAAPRAHGTADPGPMQRLGPSPQALGAALTQLRLAANIGVDDLARVIGRAGSFAPEGRGSTLSAKELMSRDVISVGPGTELPRLAALFRKHGFKSLAVLDAEGRFLGLVRLVALAGLADPATTAANLMVQVDTLPPEASLDRLIQVLADGRQEAVPILVSGRVQGIVTRSDLIAALLHDMGLR